MPIERMVTLPISTFYFSCFLRRSHMPYGPMCPPAPVDLFRISCQSTFVPGTTSSILHSCSRTVIRRIWVNMHARYHPRYPLRCTPPLWSTSQKKHIRGRGIPLAASKQPRYHTGTLLQNKTRLASIDLHMDGEPNWLLLNIQTI